MDKHLLKGVGYVRPDGEVTPWGFKIDQSVGLDVPQDKIREAMSKRYGPQWEQGATSGGLHSSDHRAALEKLWYRGSIGIGTGGILQNDGRGFNGVPTDEEVYDSYFGTKGTVLDAAHTVLPGEYGYGSTPLSPPERAYLWPTSSWRLYVSKWGAARNWPKALREEVLRQCDLIESGAIAGWVDSPMGGKVRKI